MYFAAWRSYPKHVHHTLQEWVANYWVDAGCPRDKLIIGMPTYGRGFTLVSEANNGYGAAASGPSSAGTYTREAGFLAYYEVTRRGD